MATFCLASHVKASVHKQPSTHGVGKLMTSVASSIKPILQELENASLKIKVSETIKSASSRMLDAFVDSVFQFVDRPLLPSQRNFAPVEEIGDPVEVDCVEGAIPADFPEGVYVRSVLRRSNHIWVEGEGMLHALYFTRTADNNWKLAYKNKFAECETFKPEKKLNKPGFLPAIEGDSLAVFAGFLLNTLRFGIVNKIFSNTNVFEHAGKYYSVAENYLAQEINISSLETLGNWDFSGAWDRPFTSHPKKAPGNGEPVTMGVDGVKPYYVVGVVSAEGKRLNHKVDLNFSGSILAHEVGVTEKYNIIFDYPLIVDPNRLLQGGQLIKFEKEKYSRIGVMPRYGNASSVRKEQVWWPGKIYFEELEAGEDKEGQSHQAIKIVYQKFAKNNFCPGATYVSKPGAVEEDDGWIVAFRHDEDTDTSHVLVVDANNFEEEPIAKIALPQRVPYGHHGAYFQTPTHL
ncbi:hypothetical protein RJ639_037545 [Escallonia herrerae]|uniref:Carotenoid 9,10(9',10')-cleavage dioxygenase 1-like n=1 Tax=Escallonia herrerae TaxID=1293975 RepID=A0AA88WMA4_9ASTE|nr:hypothetical protein RJ639_037545 [Escallonia herrerae]